MTFRTGIVSSEDHRTPVPGQERRDCTRLSIRLEPITSGYNRIDVTLEPRAPGHGETIGLARHWYCA